MQVDDGEGHACRPQRPSGGLVGVHRIAVLVTGQHPAHLVPVQTDIDGQLGERGAVAAFEQ